MYFIFGSDVQNNYAKNSNNELDASQVNDEN